MRSYDDFLSQNGQNEEEYENENVYNDNTCFTEPIAVLELVANDGVEEVIDIYACDVLQFGRDIDVCQVAIPHQQVSKKHFRIYSVIYEKKNDTVQPLVYCEDLESTNGTYVNGVLIGQISRERIAYLLTDGDVIEIRPSWKFAFHQPDFKIIYPEPNQFADMQYFRELFNVSNRILGQGQYGAVYLATDTSTSRQVACKIVDFDKAVQQLMHGRPSGNPGEAWRKAASYTMVERQRIKREIQILAKLSHPHIVSLKKAFYSNSTIYIMTDLAPGGDLFSYIEAHGGSLKDLHSRVIARQVVLAIEYMHSKGIVHRDIKPENVLITQTDFGGRVVLTDFGFANYAGKITGRLMSKLGTPGFIAPEIDLLERLAPNGYTKSADLWSLGVMTAFLLAGSQGIPRDEPSQLSQQDIINRYCVYGNSAWSEIEPRALSFLRKLLIMEPSHRMTATEALNHSWFKKPLSEAAILEENYKKVIRFWKHRDIEEKVIEIIPGKIKAVPVPTPKSEQLVPTSPRIRRRLPDATASPYFTLSRHIDPKVILPSKNKDLIDQLNKSGSRFVTSKDCLDKTGHPNTMLAATTAETVDGRDIFNKPTIDRSVEGNRDVFEEVVLIPTSPKRRAEKQFEFNLSDPPNSVTSPLSHITPKSTDHEKRQYFGLNDHLTARKPSNKLNKPKLSDHKKQKCLGLNRHLAPRKPTKPLKSSLASDDETPNPKRARREEEERRIHDAAAKELPRVTTAKALKDTIAKQRKICGDKSSEFRSRS